MIYLSYLFIAICKYEKKESIRQFDKNYNLRHSFIYALLCMDIKNKKLIQKPMKSGFYLYNK